MAIDQLACQSFEHRVGRTGVDQAVLGVEAEDIDGHAESEILLEPVVDLHVGPDGVLVPDGARTFFVVVLASDRALLDFPQQGLGELHAISVAGE